MVSAAGRIRGEAAQEVKIGGSANPDVVPVMRERVDNDDVRIVLGAVTVVDEDGERARSIARREVAMYLAVVAELDPTVSLEPELLARVRSGDGTAIPDAVLDRFAFAGTPADVADHAEAVFAAGAGRRRTTARPTRPCSPRRRQDAPLLQRAHLRPR